MAQSVSQSVSRFIRDGNYEGKQEGYSLSLSTDMVPTAEAPDS